LYEETISKTWVSQHGIDGIISDNRLGVLVKSSLCIYHTNYRVMTGNYLANSKLHQEYYKKNIQNAGFPDTAADLN
jgi:hypothetical protein